MPVLQLKQLLNEPNWGLMKKSLQNLSRDLPNTFQAHFSRIEDTSLSSRAHLSLNTLTRLTFTREPIDAERLQEALSIQLESTGPDEEFVPSIPCILECCLGLVVVDEHADVVRLVHFSLQEYLQTHILTMYHSGLEELALDCYRYCFYQVFSNSSCANKASIIGRLDQYDALGYCARHWRFHTSACSDNLHVQAAVIKVKSFDPHRTNLRQISRFVAGYHKQYWCAKETKSTQALHMLASIGQLPIFKQALDGQMEDISLQTGVVRSTPILITVSAGHVEVIHYLLDHGADPSIPDWYGNALHCVAGADIPATITLLLNKGMDPNICTADSVTPLACTRDHDVADAAAVLLSGKAEPINIDSQGDTNLLFTAVQNHCPRLISLIISQKCMNIEPKADILDSLLCVPRHCFYTRKLFCCWLMRLKILLRLNFSSVLLRLYRRVLLCCVTSLACSCGISTRGKGGTRWRARCCRF